MKGSLLTLILAAMLASCRQTPSIAVPPTGVDASPPVCVESAAPPPTTPLPPYLDRAARGELYVRDAGAVVDAPKSDTDVLRSYATSGLRGPLVGGKRITILTSKRVVAVGEELRVIHVLEIERPGDKLWIMGPKAVLGEMLDGRLVTAAVPPSGAFAPLDYDGVVQDSPGLDFNFEITSYRFGAPGVHSLQWVAGAVASNVVCVEVR